MDQELFSDLREIHSLDLRTFKHLASIEDEEKRVTKLIKERESRSALKEANELQLLKHKEELKTAEAALAQVEKNLEQNTANINLATSQQQADAMELQNNKLKADKDLLEEKIFEFMENIETTESEIKDAINFLKGSKETLALIEKEVLEIKSKEEQEVQALQKRINILLENFNSNEIRSINKKREVFKGKPYLAFTNANSCEVCRTTVPAADIQKLELSQSLLLCPGCSRILLPTSAR